MIFYTPRCLIYQLTGYCHERMARAYFKGGFLVPCCLLLAKGLFSNLLISCPIFTGQIPFSPGFYF